MEGSKVKQPVYIDLFAGCGGLSLGLYNAGWNGLFAIEKNKDAFKTLKHNLIDNKNHFDWPNWLPIENLEIDQVLENYKERLQSLKGKVDMVAGGPPCQGFSSAGRRKEGDVRNRLIRSYLQFIGFVQPKIIFFENVKGFTQKFDKHKTEGLIYSEFVLRTLRLLGYEVEGKMVDFSEFGIPQKRTRFILVGIRKDIIKCKKVNTGFFFEVLAKNKFDFLEQKELLQSPTLGCAISDLLKSNGLVSTPDRKNFFSGFYSNAKSKYQAYLRRGYEDKIPNSHSFPKHKQETESRFQYFLEVKKENKSIDKHTKKKFNINKHTIKPLSYNLKAPTITTLPDDYIHYCEPRIFTVREYARIQSFPDWFEFQGKYTSGSKERVKEVPRYTQIGNAIPPLFGEQCGLVLKDLLLNARRIF